MAEYSRDSSFNMGIAHLTRIDALLYAISDSASEEDYFTWHKALTLLSREVFFLYSPEEMNENNKLDNECVEMINKYNSEKTIYNKQKAYNALINYELFVKKQLSERKMLMAFSKDARFAIADLG